MTAERDRETSPRKVPSLTGQGGPIRTAAQVPSVLGGPWGVRARPGGVERLPGRRQREAGPQARQRRRHRPRLSRPHPPRRPRLQARLRPAGHGTCKTGTPKLTRGPWTSYRPVVYPACTARRISTDSARGPETMGNNRYKPGNPGMRTGRPAQESGGPFNGRRFREAPGQRPITSP